MNPPRILCILALALAFTAVNARAQAVGSFPELPLRVNLGDQLTIVDIAGMTWRGQLLRITPDELVLRSPSREFVLVRDRVNKVSVCCDGLRNGALIGLSAGLAFGGLLLGLTAAEGGVSPGWAAGGMFVYGAMGTGIGVGVDALARHSVVVYRASSTTVAVGVHAGPSAPSLGIVVRW